MSESRGKYLAKSRKTKETNIKSVDTSLQAIIRSYYLGKTSRQDLVLAMRKAKHKRQGYFIVKSRSESKSEVGH